MSYFKRFANFCAAFSAFLAGMFLFLQFMSYKPKDVDSTRVKLKMFFDATENNKEMAPYLTLILLLVLVFVTAHLFKKLVFVPITFASMSLFLVIRMVDSAKFYERPMQYVILISLSIIFYLGDAIKHDRLDGGIRAYLVACSSKILVAVMCFLIYFRAKELSSLDLDKEAKELLPRFDRELLSSMKDFDMKIFLYIAIFFIVITLVTDLFFREIHFIGAILTIAPAVYLTYLWLGGRFTVHPAPMTVLTIISAAIHVIITLSPAKKQPQTDNNDCVAE